MKSGLPCPSLYRKLPAWSRNILIPYIISKSVSMKIRELSITIQKYLCFSAVSNGKPDHKLSFNPNQGIPCQKVWRDIYLGAERNIYTVHGVSHLIQSNSDALEHHSGNSGQKTMASFGLSRMIVIQNTHGSATKGIISGTMQIKSF